MNKNPSMLIYLLFIVSIIFSGWQCNQNADSGKNNNSQAIQIEVDSYLKNDIRSRLEKLEKESLIPFEISDNLENKNIIITTDKNKIPENWLVIEIYKKELALKPDSFQKNLGDMIKNSLVIYYASIENNSIVIKDYLIDSFTKNPPNNIHLTFVGDIMLARYVGYKSQQKNNYQYPFIETADVLKKADLTIGNLESPFSENGPYLTSGMTFGARLEMMEGLKLAGFDLLNLANNHFGDSGRKNMEYTFSMLSSNKIDFFGAGKDSEQSHQPLIKEVKGIKFAFLGYTDQSLIPTSYQANDSRPGLNIMDIEQMKKDVKSAKIQADYVIVSIHAGNEYQNQPSSKQKEFAQAAIDTGADLIYGHHPHIIQGMQVYQNKPIFYSLGNFVFDQTINKTKDGLVINLGYIYNQLVSIELQTIKIKDLSQPYFPSESEQNLILNNFYKYFQT